MNKKEIQRKRVISYFIDSTKKIIREQGLKDLNIRKVADYAGYSHTTLYNYFTNFDELLCYCIIDFQKECYDYITPVIQPYNPKQYKDLILSIVDYFLKNPHIYRLIFMIEFEDIDKENRKINRDILIKMKHAPAAIELFKGISELAIKGYIRKDKAEILGSMIRELFIGKLLLHINKRIPYINDDEFRKALDLELNILLGIDD